MKTIVVDIADMEISNDPETELVTYSLGSCIGVTVYDPKIKVGGMIHCMLPLSKVDEEKAKNRPYMFVDTGIVQFLDTLFKMGVQKQNAVVKVAGGAQILDSQGLFRIGERNYTVFRKILWKNGMMIKAEDVGGSSSRTVRLDINTGRFTVRSGGQTVEF